MVFLIFRTDSAFESRYEKALNYIEHAQALAQRQGRRSSEYFALQTKALILSDMGRVDRALIAQRMAFDVAILLPNPSIKAGAAISLAESFQDRQAHDSALHYFSLGGRIGTVSRQHQF